MNIDFEEEDDENHNIYIINQLMSFIPIPRYILIKGHLL